MEEEFVSVSRRELYDLHGMLLAVFCDIQPKGYELKTPVPVDTTWPCLTHTIKRLWEMAEKES